MVAQGSSRHPLECCFCAKICNIRSYVGVCTSYSLETKTFSLGDKCVRSFFLLRLRRGSLPVFGRGGGDFDSRFVATIGRSAEIFVPPPSIFLKLVGGHSFWGVRGRDSIIYASSFRLLLSFFSFCFAAHMQLVRFVVNVQSIYFFGFLASQVRCVLFCLSSVFAIFFFAGLCLLPRGSCSAIRAALFLMHFSIIKIIASILLIIVFPFFHFSLCVPYAILS